MSNLFIPILILLALALGSAFVVVKKQLHLWLFSYLRQRTVNVIVRKKKIEEKHFIIAICDHFDFGSRGEYRQGEERTIELWEQNFPPLSDRHKDCNGINLQHTWFFPPHYDRADYLERLVNLCKRGYGEIEMHLHHDHMKPYPDTSETLRKKIRDCVEKYAKFGVFCLENGERRFGFIHGDWALDNSRGGMYCGVNDEIKILAEEGCYADFTFPSLHDAQPKKINSIYYVKDDPLKPKSYNTGIDVKVGGQLWGDLMLIQGPLWIRGKRKYGIPFFPAIESSELQGNSVLEIERMESWIEANVHVKGRPDWVFIKLHTHGAMKPNFDHNIGEMADKFFTELEEKYNNRGNGYYLHYVTSREMYNIVKAAEAGETDNPGEYRDFSIPKYVYRSN